jgi:hypothetical protein
MTSEYLEDLKATRNLTKNGAERAWRKDTFLRKVGATLMRPFL